MNIKVLSKTETKLQLKLEGALTYTTIDPLKTELQGLVQGQQAVEIDCSDIACMNSAALSFMLMVARLMKMQMIKITLLACPEDLLNIAKISGLGHISELITALD